MFDVFEIFALSGIIISHSLVPSVIGLRFMIRLSKYTDYRYIKIVTSRCTPRYGERCGDRALIKR